MDVKAAIKDAVKGEQSAQKLYMKGYRMTTNPAGRKLFKDLAAEEKNHENLLKNIDLNHPDFPNVCRQIKVEGDLMMAEASELGEIRYLLEFAVQKEKEAYKKYKALEKSVKDRKLKKLFSDIANQEQCHDKMLSKELKTIFG